MLAGLLEQHIDLPGLRWTHVTPRPVDDPSIAPFTAAYDLFDDGSLVLVPTPGHTPGSLSLLLRQPGMPPMLFVGDLTYDSELLEKERIPGVGDRAGLLESTRAVNALKRHHPDLLILAAHDPAAAPMLDRVLAGRSDAVTPAELIRYLVLAAQREGNRQLGHALRALGLTPAQSEVLRILGEHEPLTLSGIGELLVCESGSNPSRLVDRLVSAGLVERVASADDRRQVTLTLSPEGRRAESRVREVEAALYARIDAALEGVDAGPALELLRRLTAGEPAGEALAKRLAATEAGPMSIGSRTIAAPAELVRGILLRPLALPEWNPAFLAIGGSADAAIGHAHLAHGRRRSPRRVPLHRNRARPRGHGMERAGHARAVLMAARAGARRHTREPRSAAHRTARDRIPQPDGDTAAPSARPSLGRGHGAHTAHGLTTLGGRGRTSTRAPPTRR